MQRRSIMVAGMMAAVLCGITQVASGRTRHPAKKKLLETSLRSLL
jgi:hypothetical protein